MTRFVPILIVFALAAGYTAAAAPAASDEGQYITKREFRRWAKAEIPNHFSDRPRGFWMDGCKRHTGPKMTCRVGWQSEGYWTTRLTLHEYATGYRVKFRHD